MTDYCGECIWWVNSSDMNGDGRRWCVYAHRYEKATQNAKDCMCFAPDGCLIVSSICEILDEPKEKWLALYEAVKEIFAAPEHMEWLSAYYSLAPHMADRLGADEQRGQIADELIQEYIKPAYALWEGGNLDQSAKQYKEMVAYLANRYLGI